MEKAGDWLTDGAAASCAGLHLDTRGKALLSITY